MTRQLTKRKTSKIGKEIIPIMFCFDNNYVIPAAVAFYSLLEHANKEFFYKLYVLHSDITADNQKLLKQTIDKFSNFSDLEFIDMSHRFENIWQSIRIKGHFSKEVMYKILVASIFPEYSKMVVSDVDVVFLGDISESYVNFNTKDDFYLAGVKPVGKVMFYMDNYRNDFTKKEIEALSGFCGGYLVFNLEKIRNDKMEKKFIKCFKDNAYRLNQMEQDVLNLCCYPKIKLLHLKYVACTYLWDYYKIEDDFVNDTNYTKKELVETMVNPVQLHYATSIKPWKNVDCTKSEEWFRYIIKTPFLEAYLKGLPKNIIIPKENTEVKRILEEEKKAIRDSFILRRFMMFIKKNPLFLFKKFFYITLFKKISNKWFQFYPRKIIYIIDDLFPSSSSPFRYEEYKNYFKKFKNIECLTTGYSLGAVGEKRDIKSVINSFIKQNNKYKNKFYVIPFQNESEQLRFENSVRSHKKKLAVITFINNIENPLINNLELLEKFKIPFILTLYPGGGFEIDSEESDKKLKKIFTSPMFRGVIVTQKITKKYLIKNRYCDKKSIYFIPGVVTDKSLLGINLSSKKYFGEDKKTMDICFVAHRYTKNGSDKGYDKFIGVAKKLLKKYDNIFFHVVGDFNKKTINIDGLESKIKFYGIRGLGWFKDFYKDKDIILSPNTPFVLNKGSFDGFPTGASIDAMLNGVALFATDELMQNIFLENKKSFVLIKPEAEDIYRKIIFYYNNPQKIKEIALAGYQVINKEYSTRAQISSRIKIIRQLLRE